MSRRSRRLIVIALLSLTLLSCVGSGVVRKFVEPIDRATCEETVKAMPDVEFSRYVYETDACYGLTPDGEEILVYETLGLD